MVEEKGDSKAEETSDLDIGSELSTLVKEKKIPDRIATKLEQKLKEKNIQITKEQLINLVEKINNIMKSFSQINTPIKKDTPSQSTQITDKNTNEDMKRLFETLDKLEKRLNKIETGEISQEISDEKIEQTLQESKPTIVTTEDIKVPGKTAFHDWKLDPLTEVPNDPESVIVLMKWLQYLIDKCGRDNLNNILDYYVDIGWISEDAKISLIDYSHGITEEQKGEGIQRKDITDLPSKDHIQSLMYIQKLKGKKFDRHFIDRIDGELNRITKKLDNYKS